MAVHSWWGRGGVVGPAGIGSGLGDVESESRVAFAVNPVVPVPVSESGDGCPALPSGVGASGIGAPCSGWNARAAEVTVTEGFGGVLLRESCTRVVLRGCVRSCLPWGYRALWLPRVVSWSRPPG